MLTPIQTEKEYEAAKKRAAELKEMTLHPGTSEAEELEALTELIAIYERMGPVIFMRAHETVWVNEIFLDWGAT